MRVGPHEFKIELLNFFSTANRIHYSLNLWLLLSPFQIILIRCYYCRSTIRCYYYGVSTLMIMN
jgi:hypothetical protein